MLLTSAKLGPFKSIENPAAVSIEPSITVLVGMNEAGKTAFLQALTKARSIVDTDKYNPVEDYPRKILTSYLKKHEAEPDRVAELTYCLEAAEIAEIKKAYGEQFPAELSFTTIHNYKNTTTIKIIIDEAPLVSNLVNTSGLSSDVLTATSGAVSLRDLASRLDKLQRTPPDDALKSALDARINAAPAAWTSVVASELWTKFLANKMPKFLYFDDYHTLPGRMNIADLVQKLAASNSNPTVLEPMHRSVLALLRMADVRLEDLANPDGYETIKAKLEGISNSITDQVFKFWKQNENLEVEFDIRSDSTAQAPFNNGVNLYIRIKNNRHRVTVPFNQRSKGFIWFFSFLVWFDSVQRQIDQGKSAHDLILLLDEPGLSLHALAQADFLRYIDDLSGKHQVIYTTHSPFMVHPDRLHQVRIVEDRQSGGTTITDNVTGSDPRTIFPLQAALGYTLAQNLFITRRNLLVEGPADLIYLKFFSSRLEASSRVGIRSDVTIVPTGGLDKLATFVALLGGNNLEFAIVHDTSGSPDQRLSDLVKGKLLPAKMVMTYAEFRAVSATKGGRGLKVKASAANGEPPTDVEDLLSVSLYLDLFNGAFASQLAGGLITEADLPTGDRVVERITRHLAAKGIVLRPSGGYNHYAVASYLASHPPTALDSSTLDRFEALFKQTNDLYSANQDESS